MTSVFLGIGSNVDAEKNMKAAAELLRKEWPDIRFANVYASAPMHEIDQDSFLNTVALFETDAEATRIQSVLQSIERTLKKDPPFKFGPRTIDLDILLYGNEHIETQTLTVPHPRLQERRFVLEPLIELIDENTLHPVLKRSYKDLLHDLPPQGCERTNVAL